MAAKKSLKKLLQETEIKQNFPNNEWYSIRSLLGNTWAFFYILIGGREAGKSYAVMDYFVWEWKKRKKPFIWLRLTEASVRKMLSNDASQLVDADIARRYDLDLTVKGNQVFDHDEPMARVLALSTFYNDKGVALFDNEFFLGYNIALDEMNREKNEKKTFDINYAFVNQMENLIRSTKEKLRIFLIGNTLEEASDIMCSFNFIPENFGRYYVRKKKAIIDYIPPSKKYSDRRKGTVADLLAPQASTFTNKIMVDVSLIDKSRLKKPSYIVRFSKDEAYTVWDSKIVAPYNKERLNTEILMYAYLDGIFNTDLRDAVLHTFHNRGYMFKNLITQKRFKKALELMKPKG